jgi:hypothetical protein
MRSKQTNMSMLPSLHTIQAFSVRVFQLSYKNYTD